MVVVVFFVKSILQKCHLGFDSNKKISGNGFHAIIHIVWQSMIFQIIFFPRPKHTYQNASEFASSIHKYLTSKELEKKTIHKTFAFGKKQYDYILQAIAFFSRF